MLGRFPSMFSGPAKNSKCSNLTFQWSVTIPLVTSASDEKVVTKPNKFLPERFVGRNHLRPENFSYIPFSFGVRQCIGRNLADIILENLAARVRGLIF